MAGRSRSYRSENRIADDKNLEVECYITEDDMTDWLDDERVA